ncbi:hypothetical protein FBU30_008985 [Linnemannia zychae]|nr:hypothetical protein FBU30_008985 [Linnemannia zychae]
MEDQYGPSILDGSQYKNSANQNGFCASEWFRTIDRNKLDELNVQEQERASRKHPQTIPSNSNRLPKTQRSEVTRNHPFYYESEYENEDDDDADSIDFPSSGNITS